MTTACLARDENALDAKQTESGAGGIVGVGENDRAGIGRDGIEDLLERKFHLRLRVGDLRDLGAGHFGIEAVHGVGGLEDEHFLAVVDVGVDEDLDGFVGAVGEAELVGRDVEVARDGFLGGGVLGVDGEPGRGEVVLERGDDLGRTADGVLVEIQAEFVGATAGGRRVGRHADDGGTGLDGAFGEFGHWGLLR